MFCSNVGTKVPLEQSFRAHCYSFSPIDNVVQIAVWCRSKMGKLDYWIIAYFFTLITKCSNLFLPNRHQTARARCLSWNPLIVNRIRTLKQLDHNWNGFEPEISANFEELTTLLQPLSKITCHEWWTATKIYFQSLRQSSTFKLESKRHLNALKVAPQRSKSVITTFKRRQFKRSKSVTKHYVKGTCVVQTF